MLLVERVAEREVGRIPRHGVLALDVEFESRQAEAAHGAVGERIVVDGVALLLGAAGVDGVFQQHVLVERIVFWGRLLGAV